MYRFDSDEYKADWRRLIENYDAMEARGASFSEAITAMVADLTIRQAALNMMIADFIAETIECELHSRAFAERER